MNPITVAVRRGPVVEARHRVHVVAVANGKVVESAGDPGLVTFLRSAAKPIQALPLVCARDDLPDEEIAIASASHRAREEQLAAAAALLARAGASVDDLECGPHDGSRLRHNCSGKHAGMLLLARTRGWPWEGYRLPEHPVQREMLRVVADAADLAEDDLPTATDGCAVVTFAMPLRDMAKMFSRLASHELPGAEQVTEAMRAFPELVGGPDQPDTRIMRALPGAVAKGGAEALLCAALPDGTGIALKVEDGGSRAVGPAAGRFLSLPELAEAPLLNSRGEPVGTIGV